MPRISVAQPHPFDTEVGARLAARRRALRLSQTDLGQAVGITFQQVQKYERGANRVSASRLYEISKVLGVSCGWLMGENGAPGESNSSITDGSFQKLMAEWERLDERDQTAVLGLAQTLAASTPGAKRLR